MQFLSPGPAASCVFVSAVAEEECKSSPDPIVEAYLNVQAEIDHVRGPSCLRIPRPSPSSIQALVGGIYPPIMENQMEKKMENEWKLGEYRDLRKLN